VDGLLEVEELRDARNSNVPQPQSPPIPENARPQELSRNELQQELSRLMAEQISSLEWQSFMGAEATELQRQEERLNQIREISAELILAMRKPSQ